MNTETDVLAYYLIPNLATNLICSYVGESIYMYHITSHAMQTQYSFPDIACNFPSLILSVWSQHEFISRTVCELKIQIL